MSEAGGVAKEKDEEKNARLCRGTVVLGGGLSQRVGAGGRRWTRGVRLRREDDRFLKDASRRRTCCAARRRPREKVDDEGRKETTIAARDFAGGVRDEVRK